MSDSYSVYVHVNKFNNKKYVGITSAPVENRWRNGLGYKRNNYFWRAISKYGWDGFDHYVLFSGLDKSVAADIEKKLIKEYRATDKHFGYNSSTGGEVPSAGVRFKLTDEQRHKQSVALKGKRKTEEHRLAISLARQGVPIYKKRKPVLCVETGITYSGVKDAIAQTNIKHISRACNGKLKTAGGYHWRFV
jgi:hypothetical protein